MKQIVLLSLLSLIALPALAATAVSIESLISVVIYLVIVGLIFWAIWWFIGEVGVPEPFNKVIRVAVGLVALLIVIALLLGLIGQPIITLR